MFKMHLAHSDISNTSANPSTSTTTTAYYCVLRLLPVMTMTVTVLDIHNKPVRKAASACVLLSIFQRRKARLKHYPKSQSGKAEITFDSLLFDSGRLKVIFSLESLDIDMHSRMIRNVFFALHTGIYYGAFFVCFVLPTLSLD